MIFRKQTTTLVLTALLGFSCLFPQNTYAQTATETTTQATTDTSAESSSESTEETAMEDSTEETTAEDSQEENSSELTSESQQQVLEQKLSATQKNVSLNHDRKNNKYGVIEPTITLNKKKISLERNKKFNLNAKIKYSSVKKIIWKSANKKIATVNKHGIVTARRKGNTIVTARIKGTNIQAECVVKVKKYVSMWVKTTGYCNCSRCAGPWAGSRTASGTRPKENRTIAVDRRLIPLGTKVQIGDEMYVAEDTGGAIKGKKIDIYYKSHRRAQAHGVKRQKIKVFY